ncbi:MAG: hypothetical protein EXS63_07975 [Candidatus Omnitrophica bacterium]|nr:hypothetical protein [Candidatus Omnitrophota bacterium]
MKNTLKWLACLSLNLMLSLPLFAGTVTGKVNFTGTAPEPEAISMDADPVCAGAHEEPQMTEEVVVNPDNTLKNVFVYVKTGLEGQTFPAPTTPVVMDQKGCHYNPHVFGVQVGQPVQIVNSDSTLHNVHGMPTKSKEFNLGMPIQGMKLNKKFDAPEIGAKFKCDVHPWMNAYAGVTDHPFYSVTGDSGTYEIKDLPPGKYTLEAWQEKYGAKTQEITVTDAAQTADFTFAG